MGGGGGDLGGGLLTMSQTDIIFIKVTNNINSSSCLCVCRSGSS